MARPHRALGPKKLKLASFRQLASFGQIAGRPAGGWAGWRNWVRSAKTARGDESLQSTGFAGIPSSRRGWNWVRLGKWCDNWLEPKKLKLGSFRKIGPWPEGEWRGCICWQ